MSRGLLVQALGREIGQRITPEREQELQRKHAAAYEHYQATIQPLPGARELLRQLSQAKGSLCDRNQWASGRRAIGH
jgi:beta-phosphoglucomutase-like phosphatase (HAD superfamily)